MTKELDLAQVFKAVSKTLVENQSSLDEADTVNHDHGTNMVNTFKLIEKAVKAKKDGTTTEQLAYASQMLREKSTSGSAMLYADGLENAAKEFEGKTFDREGVGTLLNALMGTPQNQAQEQTPSAPQGNDFLSTLVGGMASSQQAPQGEQKPTFAQVPDLIDALGGLTFTQEPVAQEAEQNQESDQTSAIDLVGSLLGGLGQTQPAKQEEDELYQEAKRIVLTTKIASISMLQRRLKIGFNKAARLIEQMDDEGLLGPYREGKPRQVIVGKEDDIK